MSWSIYLPIAHHSVLLPVVVGLGLLVGLLSGLFGVGGGFLMTPLLIMIGIPPTVAAASDSNQIVAASASGTYAHYRLGNVDFKMGLFLLIGGVIGGTGGVQIIKVLRQLGNADFLIQITYVVMLGAVGSYMFLESLQNLRSSKQKGVSPAVKKQESAYARLMRHLPFKTNFSRSGIVISPVVPLVLGAFVGILAAIMGVGGGFIPNLSDFSLTCLSLSFLNACFTSLSGVEFKMFNFTCWVIIFFVTTITISSRDCKKKFYALFFWRQD